jgi:hypothetical protein
MKAPSPVELALLFITLTFLGASLWQYFAR